MAIEENESTFSLNRRSFLKSSGAGLTLALTTLNGHASESFIKSALSGDKPIAYASWEDVYRNKWQWDQVTWGVHTNQCLPASCLFRVYSKNGVVWREEQAAETISSGLEYPDYNPLGCQKGCGFHNSLYSQERLKYPLKRVGERGEGKWKRISWDEALGEVADSILDTHQTIGPRGFTIDAPHLHAGSVAMAGTMRTGYMMGATTTDINVALSDEFKGVTHTFGTGRQGFTADNFFDAETLIFSNINMAYTAPPLYHFVTEARYNGTEVVMLAPDYNPSCISADIHVPLKAASDAAFWMSVCQVLVEEKLVDEAFVKEQTDLPLLVRTDNNRFLRATDLNQGRDDQLYFFDLDQNRITQAPRDTLKMPGNAALEGKWEVELADGTTVQVETTYDRLIRMLNAEYRPEQAAKDTNLNPEMIRTMARKVGTTRTHLCIGWTSCKQHHGDLMERAALLALGLTGNWGKPGTGFIHFFFATEHAEALVFMEKPIEQGGLQQLMEFEKMAERSAKAKDPQATHADAILEGKQIATRAMGATPPVPWMYYHAGYDKQWDKKEWADPVYDKTFGEYLEEAKQKGGELALSRIDPNETPEVLLYINHNPLRRQRSGRTNYVETLFPKAKMIFFIETRMSSSAAFGDILLPAAWFYEKDDLTEGFLISPHFGLQQVAVKPPGEAKPEWEIFAALGEKLAERAKARGMTSFIDNGGIERLYADYPSRFTMNGALKVNKDVVREFVKFNVASGIFPPDYSYEQLEKEGGLRMAGLGRGIQEMSPATDYSNDRPFFSNERHVKNKQPYPTFARRAQFYIDHDLFLEAGEAFPVYKDVPLSGGDHPFRIISGHARNSVHSHHAAVPHFMKLHRGQPVAFINPEIAEQKGIKDGEMIRVFNDANDTEIMASLSAAAGPDQIVIYMWEPFQFKDWKSHDALLVAMPKPTHFAVDYTQLKYYFMAGTPSPSGDRALRVDFEKLTTS